jgi:murein L,D-transpeptidase YafK
MLLASAAIAGAFALAGCEIDGTSIPAHALKELSPEMVNLLEQKHMPKESAMLVRVFKEEAELEVWKQDDTGRFALLKTYPVCRWSGELGPKIKEGDRQAPEGFYNITPGQMNPNSQYFLSFNLGFPNAYDKANDRTGAFLMVHGDCSSRGCYAMTDAQIGEIYALARESFFSGQKSFQVQAYPFRMTPLNMAKHRNNPHMAFWRMIKRGYDHFELTRMEPKVDACEKRYVFDAEAPAGSRREPVFNPRAACPAYEIPRELAQALQEKQYRDEQEFASHVNSGVSTVAIRTGSDGGMHPSFLAKLKPREMLDPDGRVRVVAGVAAPASMGNNVVPPRNAETTSSITGLTSEVEPSLTNRLFSLFGASSPAPQPSQTNVAAVTLPVQKPKPKSAAPSTITPIAASFTPATSGLRSQQKSAPQDAMAESAAPKNASMNDGLMPGAQPVLPSSNFEGRWGGMR